MEDIVLDREYKSSLRCLKIGDKVAELPIIQGGMGVGVSRSSLAGAVAAEGGVGVISTAQIGYDEAGFEKDQAGSEGNKKAHMEGKGDCQGKRAGRC